MICLKLAEQTCITLRCIKKFCNCTLMQEQAKFGVLLLVISQLIVYIILNKSVIKSEECTSVQS